MDITIRNVDPKAYRGLKAQAAKSGRTIAQELNDAIHLYLIGLEQAKYRPSIFEMPTEDWGPGNERVSEQIDEILYGKDAV